MTVHASRQPESGTVLIWNDDAEHVRLTDDEAITLVFLLADLLPDQQPFAASDSDGRDADR